MLVQHLVQVEIRIRELLPNQPGPDVMTIRKVISFFGIFANIKKTTGTIVTKPRTLALRTKLNKEQKYFGVTVLDRNFHIFVKCPHSNLTTENFYFIFLLSHLRFCSSKVYTHKNFTFKTLLVCFRYRYI